jgi:arginyl-tRNA--protein-N-Asp/Glu arginylyltransferase
MEHFPYRKPSFFFTTAPMPCPYLPGRIERKVVAELSGENPDLLHDRLSRAGFRRSHAIAYVPACPSCNSCIPVRIRVADFEPHRTQKKILKANEDLIAHSVPAKASIEHFRLFAGYQEGRHPGGDMALMGFYDFRGMVEDSPVDTFIVEFRDARGDLIAACLTDSLRDGLSAVYSFFDPSSDRRSLGTFMILWLVEAARELGLPYVYLGYWISESRKMRYKAAFTPLEYFTPGGWQEMKPGTKTA